MTVRRFHRPPKAQFPAHVEAWLRNEVVPVAKAMMVNPSRAIPLEVVFDDLRALHMERTARRSPANGSA